MKEALGSSPEEVIEVFKKANKWHANIIRQMDIIIKNKESKVKLKMDNGEDLYLEGDMLKGFRIGMLLAKDMIEPFPLQIRVEEVETNEDE